MKLRHKMMGEEFETVDPYSLHDLRIVVMDKNGEQRTFKGTVLEEIPDPPTWVDVSAECEVVCNCNIKHQGSFIDIAIGYRLVKQQYVKAGADGKDRFVTAFLVERRKS